MKSHLLRGKKKLISLFSQELSKIINGNPVIKFLDVSGFNSITFSGVTMITPTLERDPLIIPIIVIDGMITPVPIVVRPKYYDNFVLFLKCIVAASQYYVYSEDIFDSVKARLHDIEISSPKIQQLPSPSLYWRAFP